MCQFGINLSASYELHYEIHSVLLLKMVVELHHVLVVQRVHYLYFLCDELYALLGFLVDLL